MQPVSKPELYAVDTINGFQTDKLGDNIDGMFRNLTEHDRPLVIWFHGGLVTRSQGYLGAALGLEGNSSLNGFQGRGVEAVYYIYESGPLFEGVKAASFLLAESLIQSKIGHLESFLRPIVNTLNAEVVTGAFKLVEEVRNKLGGLLRQIRGDEAVRLRLRSLAFGESGALAMAVLEEARVGTDTTFADKYGTDVYLRAKVQAQMMSSLTPEDASRNAFDFSLNIDPATLMFEFGLKAAKVAIAVARRCQSRRDHGLQQTIIEEVVREYIQVGPETWRQIKAEVDCACSDDPRAGATNLIKGLRTYLAEHPDRPVYLVGHSTGSIYVARFAMKAKEMGVNTPFRIRLLAAAARIDQYNALTVDSANIEKVVNFGMGDDPTNPGSDREHKEFLFDIEQLKNTPIRHLYQGSLLYMVSGACEDDADQPLMGMQRFHQGKDSPGRPDLNFGFTLVNVWSDTDHGDYQTLCHHHGGFGADPATFHTLLN